MADFINNPDTVTGRGRGGYFERVTCTADWQEIDFGGFTAMHIYVINETAESADLSWDESGPLDASGSKVKHGEIADSETLKFERRPSKKMFVKNTGGSAATLRIMAW